MIQQFQSWEYIERKGTHGLEKMSAPHVTTALVTVGKTWKQRPVHGRSRG